MQLTKRRQITECARPARGLLTSSREGTTQSHVVSSIKSIWYCRLQPVRVQQFKAKWSGQCARNYRYRCMRVSASLVATNCVCLCLFSLEIY